MKILACDTLKVNCEDQEPQRLVVADGQSREEKWLVIDIEGLGELA